MMSILTLILNIWFLLGFAAAVSHGPAKSNHSDTENSIERAEPDSGANQDLSHGIQVFGAPTDNNRKPSRYQKRIKNKIEELGKVGVEPKIAKQVYMKHLSNSLRTWRENNPERAKQVNDRYFSKNKESINAKRRLQYHEKKMANPDHFKTRHKRQKELGLNTYHGRYEARLRNNFKKGMSETEAKKAAQTYIDEHISKVRLRLKLRRQRMEKTKQ